MNLPDETLVYVPGVGEVTVGQIRGPVGGPASEDDRFWAELVTRNLEFKLCPDGAIRRVRRA